MPTARPATHLQDGYCGATFEVVMMSSALAGQRWDCVYILPSRGVTRLGWNKWLGKTPGYFQNACQCRRRRGLYVNKSKLCHGRGDEAPPTSMYAYVMRSPCLLGLADGGGSTSRPSLKLKISDLVSETRLSGLMVHLDDGACRYSRYHKFSFVVFESVLRKRACWKNTRSGAFKKHGREVLLQQRMAEEIALRAGR